MHFTYIKENNIRNIFHVLMLQQLLANKHDKLRDLAFRRVEVWVWWHKN